MPTSTLSGHTFHNIGQLTTTWTAPAACATITQAPELGRAVDLAAGHGYWSENCDWYTGTLFDQCVPSASEMNEVWTSAFGTPGRLKQFFYHSPGVCPSNWTPVGVAARHDSSSYSLDGAFTNPTLTFTYTESTTTETTTVSGATPWVQPPLAVFASALDIQETATICCPSGYTVHPLGYDCFSTAPREAYTATTGCQMQLLNDYTRVDVTYTYHGRTITGEELSMIGTVQSLSTYVVTLDAEFIGTHTEVYSALFATPAVMLVNGKSDTTATPAGTTGTDGATATGTGQATTPTEAASAAASVGMSPAKLLSFGLATCGVVALLASF